jgi:uncharacterized repeat protein (TIGR03803 family)
LAASGQGVVFKLDKAGTETVLYSFAGGTDGGQPAHGVVFKLDTTGTEAVVYSFTGTDGWEPAGGVIRDSAGNLYGTTAYGGTSNAGVVFTLAP